VEAFDCVYYKDTFSDMFVPFYREDGRSNEINRKMQTCAPESEKHQSGNGRQSDGTVC
jgi:hypothetical protein